MSEPAILVKDLKKDFLLTHSGVAALKTLVVKWKKRSRQHLHVLKGISFEVQKGECVAIIGRNGAGKSTLLALLAQIYRPSAGYIEINGRVAPLLELGAGFHPDLTGLENIFVNGMILGISRAELEKRLDKIIEFSELFNQIDSPVRTYSSGMSARLGFSIAVHVDADILLVDEVLAVGDFEFKAKCEAKIDELKEQGKTILMVSHGSHDVKRLADRCIWIQQGLIRMEGPPKEVLKAYSEGSINSLATDRVFTAADMANAIQSEGNVLDVPPEFNFLGPSVLALGTPAETGCMLWEYMSKRMGVADLVQLDVLDFGCGTRFAEAILNGRYPIKGYTGIDVHRGVIDFLQRNISDPRLDFGFADFAHVPFNPRGRSMTAESKLPIGDRTFDVCTMFSYMIHRLPDDARSIFTILRRHVNPEGKLFFSISIDDSVKDSQRSATVPGVQDYSRKFVEAVLKETGWKVVNFEKRNPGGLPILDSFLCEPI